MATTTVYQMKVGDKGRFPEMSWYGPHPNAGHEVEIISSGRGYVRGRSTTDPTREWLWHNSPAVLEVEPDACFERIDCLEHGTKWGYCEECAFFSNQTVLLNTATEPKVEE